LCRKLIGTMPRRIIDVIKAKGGYTKWWSCFEFFFDEIE
jgi:hypothetical protein